MLIQNIYQKGVKVFNIHYVEKVLSLPMKKCNNKKYYKSTSSHFPAKKGQIHSISPTTSSAKRKRKRILSLFGSKSPMFDFPNMYVVKIDVAIHYTVTVHKF